MNDSNGKVTFRRVRGRIVPIRAAAMAASGAATAYTVSKKVGAKPSGKSGPNRFLQASAIGLNVASALVSAFPFRGKLGFAGSQLASIGVDALGTSLNAASVAKMKGSRKAKLKEFAKAEATSQAVGYGAWGAALLSNKAFRGKAVEILKKATTKIGRFGVKAAI